MITRRFSIDGEPLPASKNQHGLRNSQEKTPLDFLDEVAELDVIYHRLAECYARFEGKDPTKVDKIDVERSRRCVFTLLVMMSDGPKAKVCGIDAEAFLAETWVPSGHKKDTKKKKKDPQQGSATAAAKPAPPEKEEKKQKDAPCCRDKRCHADAAFTISSTFDRFADPNPHRNKCYSLRQLEKCVGKECVKAEDLDQFEAHLTSKFSAAFPHNGSVTGDESNCPHCTRFATRGRGRDGKDELVTCNCSKPDPLALMVKTMAVDVHGFIVPALIALARNVSDPEHVGTVRATVNWMSEQGVNHNPSGDQLTTLDRWFTTLGFFFDLLAGDDRGNYHNHSLARKRLSVFGVPVADLLEFGLQPAHHRLFCFKDPRLVLYISYRSPAEQKDMNRSEFEKTKMSMIHLLTNAYTVVPFEVGEHPAAVIAAEAAQAERGAANDGVRHSARNRPAPASVVKSISGTTLESLRFLCERFCPDREFDDTATKDDLVAVLTSWKPEDVKAAHAPRPAPAAAPANAAANDRPPAQTGQKRNAKGVEKAAGSGKRAFRPRILADFVNATDADIDVWLNKTPLREMKIIDFGRPLGTTSTFAPLFVLYFPLVCFYLLTQVCFLSVIQLLGPGSRFSAPWTSPRTRRGSCGVL